MHTQEGADNHLVQLVLGGENDVTDGTATSRDGGEQQDVSKDCDKQSEICDDTVSGDGLKQDKKSGKSDGKASLTDGVKKETDGTCSTSTKNGECRDDTSPSKNGDTNSSKDKGS